MQNQFQRGVGKFRNYHFGNIRFPHSLYYVRMFINNFNLCVCILCILYKLKIKLLLLFQTVNY